MRYRSSSVARQISQQIWRFDFYQAVRLLEAEHALHHLDTHQPLPSPDNLIQFSTSVGLSFYHGQINELKLPEDDDNPIEMVVNFFGLIGIDGPLPHFYTEEILTQESRYPGESAIRKFTDLFNHRLIRLKYDVRKAFRPDYQPAEQRDDILHDSLFALLGIAPPKLRHRMTVSDTTLLRYTALLHGAHRSLHGLQVMLADFFAMPIQCQSLTGCWQQLEPEEQCRLGSEGVNQRLGRTSILGHRVWDQGGKFTIHIEAMSWTEFIDFLPLKNARAFRQMTDLIHMYLTSMYACDVIVRIATDLVPKQHKQHRLGWNSVLEGMRPGTRYIEVRLDLDNIPDQGAGEPRIPLGSTPDNKRPFVAESGHG